jgi:chromosome segregation ATPase
VETNLINAALKDGLWAALFISLYLYQLKESRRNQDDAQAREGKLMTFIDEISSQFEKLARQYERLSEDVREIKNDISERRAIKRKGEPE